MKTLLTPFSGTDLQARQKGIKKQAEIILSGHFFIHVLNLREFKSVRVVSKFTWPLLNKCSACLHLGDSLSPVKSMEGEQSAVLAFYAGAQDAHARLMNMKKGPA